MEQNKYEVLEEITSDMDTTVTNVAPLKEYEKLLRLEASRVANEQAKKLVKLGCFEQKQETTVDFSRLEKQDGKKYKGLYQLYRNLDTMQLVYVCPLVENNKGADDEVKDMKPYAYDCLYVEQMDSETYNAVLKAAKNNLNNGVKALFITSIVLYCVMAVLSLVVFFTILFTSIEGSGFMALPAAALYAGTMLAILVCSMPLLLLTILKYKKYKDQ